MRWFGLLVVLVLLGSAGPAAAGCADPESTLRADVRVVREVSSGDVSVVRVEVLAVEAGAVEVGDQILVRGADGLDVGDVVAIEATGESGTYELTGCGAVATAAPTTTVPDADDEDSTQRSVGVITMTIAVLGVGFAYIRTRRRVSHWD